MSAELIEHGRSLGRCYLHSVGPAHHASAASILCIPGSAHGWWAWRFWLPAFARAGFAAHALSFPNHTDAPMLDTPAFCALTLGDYVAEVRAIAASLPGPVVLVGHSLGGMVAQVAAQDSACAALVLVASSGPRQLGTAREWDYPCDTPVVFAPDAARARWFADADPAIVAWALAQLSPESPGVLNGSGGRAVVDPARIACPVLVMQAGLDVSSVPPQDRLAALYGADHVVIEGAGHDIMLERASLHAVQRVIGWLDGKMGVGRDGGRDRD